MNNGKLLNCEYLKNCECGVEHCKILNFPFEVPRNCDPKLDEEGKCIYPYMLINY